MPDRQLLHLVIGGELSEVSPHANQFKDLSKVEFVGAFANYEDARRAWKSAAQATVDRLLSLYAARPELEWGRTRIRERRGESFDASTVLALAETELLAPLDQQARREIEAAARTVAGYSLGLPISEFRSMERTVDRLVASAASARSPLPGTGASESEGEH